MTCLIELLEIGQFDHLTVYYDRCLIELLEIGQFDHLTVYYDRCSMHLLTGISVYKNLMSRLAKYLLCISISLNF